MSARFSMHRFSGLTYAFGPAIEATIHLTNESDKPFEPIGVTGELHFQNTMLASANCFNRLSSGQGLFPATMPPRQVREFRLLFLVPYGAVVHIDRKRMGDPQFAVKVWGVVLEPETHRILGVGEQEQMVTVSESDWARWVQAWGREAAWLYVSGPAAAKLNELKNIVGKQADEDLVWEIAARLSEWQSLKSRSEYQLEFLTTLPDRKEIREHLLEWLPTAVTYRSPVRICCQALDGALQHTLHDLLREKVEVRIVCRPLDNVKEKGVKDAVRALREAGAQVRFSEMAHARLYVTSTGCLVTAADPKTDSLDVNREAALWTDNPAIIERAIWFFEKLWEESK